MNRAIEIESADNIGDRFGNPMQSENSFSARKSP